MNELSTELKLLHEETINNLKNSKANNTLRAYKSDFADFGAFCARHNFNSLPTDPKIVSLYLTHLSKKSKISTLRRRLVSISMFHKLKGHYLDTKHPIIIENLMGIRRVVGSIQKGKKPILINHLKLIINVINNQKVDQLKKLRDKSIILIGFGGGFRRTELVSINYDDLEFVSEGLKIKIKKSKTDQFGEGMTKGLPYFTNEIYCPVTNLKKWLEISKIKSGPIFRRFTKGLSLSDKRLTDQSVVLLIKEYLNLAGIENKNYSGHSLRSGFATVAAESGADERSIMAMTGHKTTQMVRRYIKEANIFKNNALNKVEI
ncbi:site-specific integrase [Candidatus Pelagibacter sp.]|uniref:site-specific integrase n=1 Tax=Candidatus Pelagibacter sp. TaxID=2024849 RepID=UPI003F82D7BA|tara:strand:- start:987 stop:1940 length:954 start_codon:yes stop_codon:yes gene_type:complete